MSDFTCKHYEAIAATVAKSADYIEICGQVQFESTIKELADLFEKDNMLFDRVKFTKKAMDW